MLPEIPGLRPLSEEQKMVFEDFVEQRLVDICRTLAIPKRVFIGNDEDCDQPIIVENK